MIPATFDYEVAESPEHAIELLGGRDDAKLLAGGHSLLPAMKLRIARPSLLVDLGRLEELSYVRDAGEQIAIGALTRYKDIVEAPLLQEHCPIVSYAAGQVGDPQVRHRGTIGGSLAHGDPASDLPAVILALGAEMVVRGAGEERVVPASEFFPGVFQTALGPSELLTEIRVPKLGSTTGWSYTKMSRRAQDWATVAVAVFVERQNGSIGRASIALTNMGATPLRATQAEEAIAGGASIADAAPLIPAGTDPPSDTSASAEFRRHLAQVLGRRALEEALGR
jgi:carbon-monoxide dehydrogenase medium subunit